MGTSEQLLYKKAMHKREIHVLRLLLLCGTQLVFRRPTSAAAVWGGHPAGVSMAGSPWSCTGEGTGEAAQHFHQQYYQALLLHMKDLGNLLFKKVYFFKQSWGN